MKKGRAWEELQWNGMLTQSISTLFKLGRPPTKSALTMKPFHHDSLFPECILICLTTQFSALKSKCPTLDAKAFARSQENVAESTWLLILTAKFYGSHVIIGGGTRLYLLHYDTHYSYFSFRAATPGRTCKLFQMTSFVCQEP